MIEKVQTGPFPAPLEHPADLPVYSVRDTMQVQDARHGSLIPAACPAPLLSVASWSTEGGCYGCHTRPARYAIPHLADPVKRSFITCDDPDRRGILCGGCAAPLVCPCRLSRWIPARNRAEALSGTVPELDSLSVRIVTDSYQFAVAPSQKIEGLAYRAFRLGHRPRSSAWTDDGQRIRPLHARHIAARRGDPQHIGGFRLHARGAQQQS